MSKTPSQLRKNGHSSDIGPDFITSTAVEAVADDEPDVTIRHLVSARCFDNCEF